MKIISEQFTNLNHKILHGRLSTEQIEKTMQDVWDRKVDVLFATTIVEAGIDLPKVNTLITLRSELLGMSQLYQLKGRVGRRGDQSFAYFFHTSNLGIDAELRLDAIKSIGQTATGYSLAMKDLQLRVFISDKPHEIFLSRHKIHFAGKFGKPERMYDILSTKVNANRLAGGKNQFVGGYYSVLRVFKNPKESFPGDIYCYRVFNLAFI